MTKLNNEILYENYILNCAYKRKEAVLTNKKINLKLRELIIKNNFEATSIIDHINISSKIEKLLTLKKCLYKKHHLYKWNLNDIYFYNEKHHKKCFYCKFNIISICKCNKEFIFTDLNNYVSFEDVILNYY